MKNNHYHNYKTSEMGDYIFEIGNKLVYTDGDYDYPTVYKVITINSNIESEIEHIRSVIYGIEEGKYSFTEANQAIEQAFRGRPVFEALFESSSAYGRQNGRGKGKNSGGRIQENGKGKYSIRDTEAQKKLRAMADVYGA